MQYASGFSFGNLGVSYSITVWKLPERKAFRGENEDKEHRFAGK